MEYKANYHKGSCCGVSDCTDQSVSIFVEVFNKDHKIYEDVEKLWTGLGIAVMLEKELAEVEKEGFKVVRATEGGYGWAAADKGVWPTPADPISGGAVCFGYTVDMNFSKPGPVSVSGFIVEDSIFSVESALRRSTVAFKLSQPNQKRYRDYVKQLVESTSDRKRSYEIVLNYYQYNLLKDLMAETGFTPKLSATNPNTGNLLILLVKDAVIAS